jgi:S-adenosyl methyltransferase
MPDFDTRVPHNARVYNYLLGGKDNFAADRAAGERFIAAFPNVVHSVRANRAFLARAVRFLAADAGIRQFLDIGTGVPTADNTHEVAQRFAPGSRVVYVDNDPIVLSHAQALLKSSREGACAYIDADLREPGKILAAAAGTLDFARPVAVMLVAVLQLIGDADDPAGVVARLMAACAPGSFLVISHPASDLDAGLDAATRQFNQSGGERATNRDQAAVTRLFDGCELLEPGVVQVSDWRPVSDLETARGAAVWAGVARKP